MRPLKEILPIVRTFLCTVNNTHADAFCCLAAREAIGQITVDEYREFERGIFAEMRSQGLPYSGETLSELLVLKDSARSRRYTAVRSHSYIAARDKWLDEWQLKLEKQS